MLHNQNDCITFNGRWNILLKCLLILAISIHLAIPLNAVAQEIVPDVKSTEDALQETQETRKRELTAEEDPLAEREAGKEERDLRWYAEPNTARVYGSAQIRYRDTGGDTVWGDGGSRIGIVSHWQFLPKRWLFGSLEVGFNLLDRVDQLIDRGSASSEDRSDIFERLAYIGYEGPNLVATYGKNWSAYYKVANYTDHFEGTGSSASGVFNARTDGGATGTGRADGVLQTRFHIDFFKDFIGVKPFNLNLQVQHGQPIPGIDNVDYGTAIGLSAILMTEKEFTLGIGYNYADVPYKDNAAVRKAGIDGDAQALVLGTRWFGENWYLGAIITRLNNHETTDTLTYFHGSGYELYGQYRLRGPWWMIGGVNYLAPDDDQTQAGDYEVNYGVLGIRYSIDEFRRILYFNAQINNGSTTDGESADNIYTIGIHWDLDKTFSWVPKWR
jgi:predicted porin